MGHTFYLTPSMYCLLCILLSLSNYTKSRHTQQKTWSQLLVELERFVLHEVSTDVKA